MNRPNAAAIDLSALLARADRRWQFNAVEPGLLGRERHFNRFCRTPIERHGDAEASTASTTASAR